MTDIGAELYEAIKAEFDKAIEQDAQIKSILKRIETGKAASGDIALYAQRLGARLRQAIEHNISADKLPNGQMYYNIAEKVLRPSLQTNYELFNAVAARIQAAVDAKQGIRIAAQQAALQKSRIDVVIDAASQEGIAEATMIRRMAVPAETITQSYADNFIRSNASFRSKAGFDMYIVRKEAPNCCEWCSKIGGKYRYPEEVPKDAFRRHDNCGCTVEMISNGMSTNVHSKRQSALTDEQKEQIAQAELKRPTVLSPEEGAKTEAKQLAKLKGRLTGEAESGINQ